MDTITINKCIVPLDETRQSNASVEYRHWDVSITTSMLNR